MPRVLCANAAARWPALLQQFLPDLNLILTPILDLHPFLYRLPRIPDQQAAR
jgi:hypothetical protein